MNIFHIKELINRVLKGLNAYEPELEILILGTFLIESDLVDIHNDEKFDSPLYKVGFMQMDVGRLYFLVDEYLPYRTTLLKNIQSICGVDLKHTPFETIKKYACENLSLMIILTYLWYSSQYEDVPDNNLKSIARCYKEYYNGDPETHSVSEFVQLLKDELYE